MITKTLMVANLFAVLAVGLALVGSILLGVHGQIKLVGILQVYLWGAIVGTAAGLLLAPKSGKENRKMVGEKSVKIRSRTGGAIVSVKSRIKKTPSETAVEEPSNNGAHALNLADISHVNGTY